VKIGFNGPKALFQPTTKQSTLEVFRSSGTKGRAELVTLADRQVNGKSALLDVDKNGKALLSGLYSLATQPLHSDIEKASGVTRKNLLYSVMKEAANPGKVNQGSHGTCTVSNICSAKKTRLNMCALCKGSRQLQEKLNCVEVKPSAWT